MDSLTQIVLGAAVGEFYLGSKIGNRAALYGGIIGTIPDLDVLVGKFVDPLTAVEIHRGFSHSIIFFLILSPILGCIISKIESKINVTFKDATIMAFITLFTHALLDAFTTWGTQIFWPFGERIAWKTIFVVDPLYTVPFLILLISALRLPKTLVKRRKLNNLGILISSGYLLLSVLSKNVAEYKFESALERQNISYSRIIVKPAPLNIILWNANVETADGYLLADYSYFDRSPIAFDFIPSGVTHIADLQNSNTISRLKNIAENWFVITKEGEKRFFNDLRFGMLNNDVKNPEFIFKYELIPDGNDIRAIESENKGRDEGAEILLRLFRRIGGE